MHIYYYLDLYIGAYICLYFQPKMRSNYLCQNSKMWTCTIKEILIKGNNFNFRLNYFIFLIHNWFYESHENKILKTYAIYFEDAWMFLIKIISPKH